MELNTLIGIALLASPSSTMNAARTAHTGTLSTTDVKVAVSASGNRLTLQELRGTHSGQNWAAGSSGGTALVSSAKLENKTVRLEWRATGCKVTANRMVFRFESSGAKLVATSEWVKSKSYGPIRHTLSIKNLGTKPIALPLQKSLSWNFKRHENHNLEAWWVEKAAGRPSRTGVHRDPIDGGYRHSVLSEPYISDKRAYSEDWRDRDAVPWVTVWDKTAQSGWYAGVEFSGRVSLDLAPSGRNRTSATIGIADEPAADKAFQTVVKPGETYSLPTVFVGCFSGHAEDGCNQMRQWVDKALRPVAMDKRYPLLTLNSWGSGMAVDTKLAYSMMGDAAGLGLEMFHIDAGWFRGVGDWRPNLDKFPAGVTTVADHAHSLGLKFGLWVGWTQGGIRPESENPERVLNIHSQTRQRWFSHDYPADWKPADFVGADLCLAEPHAVDWCTKLLDSVVSEYKLDMLEHDQRTIVSECDRSEHGHTDSHGDIAYYATKGYYRVYDAIRSKYPHLLFEDCVNGGRVVDYGVIQRAHYISIVDSYFPLANRRAIYDLTFAIPASMCECYVMEIPLKSLGEFQSMLRSGLMGWCSIMQDPAKWSPEQRAAARREFEFYKSTLRPLILNGNIYHVSERPDGIRWDGMQYASRSKRESVLYAFRGTTQVGSHTYLLSGLDEGKKYRVHFRDPYQPDQTRSGHELMTVGIEVKLDHPETSNLVHIVATK